MPYPEDAVPYRPRLLSRFWILNSDCWVLVPDSWGRSGGSLSFHDKNGKARFLVTFTARVALSARGEEAILQFFDDDEDTWALLGELGPEKGLCSSSTNNSGPSGRHPLKAGVHPMRTTAELEAEAAWCPSLDAGTV